MGCSEYVTPQRNAFKSHYMNSNLYIYTTISELARSPRFSSILFGPNNANGDDFVIQDILHLHSLGWNVLSVSELNKKRFSVLFGDGNIVIQGHDTSTVATTMLASKPNELGLDVDVGYKTSSKIFIAWSAITNDYMELWHRYLGYLNHDALVQLSKQGLIGPPLLKLPKVCICISCINRKMKPTTFKASITTIRHFHLVNMNLRWLMQTHARDNRKYIMVITEGYATNCETETLAQIIKSLNVSRYGSNFLRSTSQVKPSSMTFLNILRVVKELQKNSNNEWMEKIPRMNIRHLKMLKNTYFWTFDQNFGWQSGYDVDWIRLGKVLLDWSNKDCYIFYKQISNGSNIFRTIFHSTIRELILNKANLQEHTTVRVSRILYNLKERIKWLQV